MHHIGTCFAVICAVVISRGYAMTPHLFKELQPDQRGIVDPQPGNISEQCQQEIFRLYNTSSTYYETLLALDSFGKPQSGFLVGNTVWLGHYDECMNLTDYRYCIAPLLVTIISPYTNATMTLTIGICAPKKCSSKDIVNGFDQFESMIPGLEKYLVLNESQYNPTCTEKPHKPLDAGFFGTVSLFSLIFLTVVACSLYQAWYDSSKSHADTIPVTAPPVLVEPEEYAVPDTAHLIGSSANSVHIRSATSGQGSINTISKDSPYSSIKQIISSFSLLDNVPKLLGPTSADNIDCLHGMRVISMLWVILGHVFIFPLTSKALVNPLTGLGWLNRYGFMMIVNGFLSVDSFFFLSGLLLCYLTLNRMAKTNGKIPWGWFYFHRYWRLTPAIAMTMLLYMYIIPYLGEGPFAQSYSYRPNCPKYWWTNLLYINNFYPKFEEGCINWVWYLANDMQFFVISPLILVPLYHFPIIGFSLIVTIIASSMAVTATLTVVYDLPANPFDSLFNPALGANNFYEILYVKPYCRIIPYLVGMMMGYFMHKHRNFNVKLHPAVVFVGWCISGALGTLVVYIIYPTLDGFVWSPFQNALYQMLSRFLWSVYLSWMVFACHYGHGGWINSILSYKAWAPFSRLTYTAYLLHPIMLLIFSANQGQSYYLSLTLIAFYFGGVSLISYGTAALFSLCVEFPLAGIEKLFIPRNN